VKAIGVDPGLTGAISLLCTERGLLECADIPTCPNGTASGSMKRWLDAPALAALVDDWAWRHDFARDAVAGVVERPIPMPTLPAQTIASQFDTFGAIRAILARRAAVHFVNPREWKKSFKLGNDKDIARAVCRDQHPTAPVTLVKHHNRAESILIAHHWLLVNHGPIGQRRALEAA
jgi:hypothetical protein